MKTEVILWITVHFDLPFIYFKNKWKVVSVSWDALKHLYWINWTLDLYVRDKQEWDLKYLIFSWKVFTDKAVVELNRNFKKNYKLYKA